MSTDSQRLSTSDLVATADEPGDAGEGATDSATDQAIEAEAQPLLPRDDAAGFDARWKDIQTGFVDEPRKAVEDADALVAEVMQRLAQIFSDERQELERQWGEGEDVSTEQLRVALQRYRSFFQRLLST
jgi:hypothetical protein